MHSICVRVVIPTMFDFRFITFIECVLTQSFLLLFSIFHLLQLLVMHKFIIIKVLKSHTKTNIMQYIFEIRLKNKSLYFPMKFPLKMHTRVQCASTRASKLNFMRYSLKCNTIICQTLFHKHTQYITEQLRDDEEKKKEKKTSKKNKIIVKLNG